MRAILAAVLALPALATPVFAGHFGLHEGAFFGAWCGERARYDVLRWEPSGGGYHGRLWLIGSDAYDRLWIEPYPDGSLRIVRFLAGAQSGETQSILTYPPQEKRGGGGIITTFQSQSSVGPGCDGYSSVLNVSP